MCPRRRILCAVLALGFGLLGLSSSWGQPTSQPSTLAPGSVVLSAEDYSALMEAQVQAQIALSGSSQTIKNLSDTVTSNSNVITTQSEALKNSSTVIAEQARHLTRLSNACVVLGSVAAGEAVAIILMLLL